jgi:pyrimidine operon attenuation protein/uracil phosphoribosyltransferase
MKILDEKQVRHRITRLAMEILENNLAEESLILAGINNNGLAFARLLLAALKQFSDKPIVLTNVRLNPADPANHPVEIGLPLEDLRAGAIIITDDVANTGRTIFYAFKPLLTTLPKRVEVAVLVDRQHKLFPIRADYVGLSLATTLMENIEVRLKEGEMAVYLGTREEGS